MFSYRGSDSPADGVFHCCDLMGESYVAYHRSSQLWVIPLTKEPSTSSFVFGNAVPLPAIMASPVLYSS
jgi:hypothetical protein